MCQQRWIHLSKDVQFMLDCRPFYTAGFNAHDLVPKVLATTSTHKTFGRGFSKVQQVS